MTPDFIKHDDLQHALMEVDENSSKKICKSLRLPEYFGNYCGDDRGNRVDFYDRNGIVAVLDREALDDDGNDISILIDEGIDDNFKQWVSISSWANEMSKFIK